MSALDKQFRILLIEGAALGLDIRADGAADIGTLIMLKMALLHRLVYNIDSALDKPALVGILDSEQELALIVARDKVGVERGAQIANVHVSRGGRSKACTHLACGDAALHFLKPLHVLHFVFLLKHILYCVVPILFYILPVVKMNLIW